MAVVSGQNRSRFCQSSVPRRAGVTGGRQEHDLQAGTYKTTLPVRSAVPSWPVPPLLILKTESQKQPCFNGLFSGIYPSRYTSRR